MGINRYLSLKTEVEDMKNDVNMLKGFDPDVIPIDVYFEFISVVDGSLTFRLNARGQTGSGQEMNIGGRSLGIAIVRALNNNLHSIWNSAVSVADSALDASKTEALAEAQSLVSELTS